MRRVAVAGPWITQKEIDYVTDAVTNAWYEQANTYIARFEQAFAALLGRKHAIALPSCTSALHLMLAALDLKPGDEVIVPESTWIATSAPISYVGATPVFADIDPRSWCMDAGSLKACITERTRAVIVVDLYGSMPDMEAIAALAARHNIALIEDAAEAIGSMWRGAPAGSFGVAGTFSFHGSKTVTTGEGGMLTLDDDRLYERCLFLRDHGRAPGVRLFWNTEVGYKYKMSSMQAALGLAQIERIEELIARKRQIFSWYQQALGAVEGITLNAEAPGTMNSYWMVTAVYDAGRYPVDSAVVQTELRARGIDCRPFFYPLSSLPAYANTLEARRARERNKVAYSIAPRALNLPSNLLLTQDTVREVCDAFVAILRRYADAGWQPVAQQGMLSGSHAGDAG